jgi:hypothetical protein
MLLERRYLLTKRIRRSEKMIEKHLLVVDRVRRPPREGFSWVDRRFLRDFASRLSGNAVSLYLFLAAVSDKHGLSFYGDATLAVRLRIREESVVAARDELVIQDLVAYQPPLTQVLSLPQPRVERSGPAALRELLRAEIEAEPCSSDGSQS